VIKIMGWVNLAKEGQQVLAIPGEFMMTAAKNFEARGTHLSSMRNIVAE
jgi:hypothetical protein